MLPIGTSSGHRICNLLHFSRTGIEHCQNSVQTEKVMKALYVRKLFLWPRFQMSVKEALEERVTTPADVGTVFPCPCMPTCRKCSIISVYCLRHTGS